MRTTLDIDDDVLRAAKELAAARKETAGRVLSELARAALSSRAPGAVEVRNGFELLPAGGRLVTTEAVEALLDEDA
ncbi:MAG: antitoxin [Gammaproteobacteria bacterium]